MEIIYVLINVPAGHVEDVLKSIRNIKNVKEAHAVTGRYDIISKVEGKDIPELLHKVLKEIQTTKGVEETESLIAVEL